MGHCRQAVGHKGARHIGDRLIVLAAAVMLAASPAAADFESGWQAYQRGDFAAALAEWKPLAGSGDARAQYNLGVLFDQGKGVAQDRARAVAWWTKAAAQGMAAAQHNLANSMIAGDGVEQDYAAAIGWLKQAAAQGLGRSKYTLGKMYSYGLGVEANVDEAFRLIIAAALNWFRRAAAAGYAKAQANLGERYMRGDGIGKDPLQALMWTTLAANQGLERAIKFRQTLLETVSPEVVAAADNLVAGFTPAAGD